MADVTRLSHPSGAPLRQAAAGTVAEVTGLTVTAVGGGDILRDVSISVSAGEIVGLVGESGSGKSTLGLALLGFARRGLRIAGGQVAVDGQDLLAMPAREAAARRGRVVAYVPQDASVSMNPARKLDRQVDEMLTVHLPEMSRADRLARITGLLTALGLQDPAAVLGRYPHQLSGGQLQRFAIAQAFVCTPRLVVLDEPTTGQDVVTQELILDAVRLMCERTEAAAVFISHDLSLVTNLADRVAVMYSGELVELALTAELVSGAAHPYTRKLLAAAPLIDDRRPPQGIAGHAPVPARRPAGCAFAPRCDQAAEECTRGPVPVVELSPRHVARCTQASVRPAVPLVTLAPNVREPSLGEPGVHDAAGDRAILTVRQLRAAYRGREVVRGIDLDLERGQCVALVGESGSGKSTTARSIAGIHGEFSGDILLDGERLVGEARRRDVRSRRAIRYVFQNPYGSLNPRKDVFTLLAQPYRILTEHKPGPREVEQAVRQALDSVSLSSRFMTAVPSQLSGGERQRVAIARAIVSQPAVLICDEITAPLDVSVQASIVALLNELRASLGLSVLFITHQLELITSVASTVTVMRHGEAVERGPVTDVVERPAHEYTKTLIAAARRKEATEKATDKAIGGQPQHEAQPGVSG